MTTQNTAPGWARRAYRWEPRRGGEDVRLFRHRTEYPEHEEYLRLASAYGTTIDALIRTRVRRVLDLGPEGDDAQIVAEAERRCMSVSALLDLLLGTAKETP